MSDVAPPKPKNDLRTSWPARPCQLNKIRRSACGWRGVAWPWSPDQDVSASGRGRPHTRRRPFWIRPGGRPTLIIALEGPPTRPATLRAPARDKTQTDTGQRIVKLGNEPGPASPCGSARPAGTSCPRRVPRYACPGSEDAPSHPARATEGAILACATIAPVTYPLCAVLAVSA